MAGLIFKAPYYKPNTKRKEDRAEADLQGILLHETELKFYEAVWQNI